MDGSNSEAAREDVPATDYEALKPTARAELQSEADIAAEGLRDQIAALRRQVKDAQDTLREREQRREAARAFKD